MFKKLISNLPFNPSLVSQVSFYAKRVQQEASVRRMGFLLIALAMFIQMFAVIAPPEKSLAASADHILDGIRTSNDIVSAWQRQGSDLPAIYGKFGLTLEDIKGLPLNPNATIVSKATGPDYWTIGRNSLSGYTNVKSIYKNSEIALQTGPSTVYMRALAAWNIKNPSNTYRAFTGFKKSDNTQFWILVDCGNYTQIGKFAPKKPQISIRKSILGGKTTLQAGDTFTFRIEYRNFVKDSIAENVLIHDALKTTDYDIVNRKSLMMVNDNLRQGIGNLRYTDYYRNIDIVVRLKNPFPNVTGQSCNTAKATSSNAPDAISGPACVTVKTLCQIKPSDPSCQPPPTVYCSLTDLALNKSTREATLKTTVKSTNEAATLVSSYSYDFGDDSKIVIQPSTKLTDTIKHIYPAGDYTAKVTVSFTAKGKTEKQQASCQAPISFDEDKPFGLSKDVKNITQKLEGTAAKNAKVNAGDVLEYTLTTSNTQDFSRGKHTVIDYVGDILDYADIDLAFLKEQGGTFNADTKKVSFIVADMKANSDVLHKFRATLKNPMPVTNQPSTVSGTYDCIIANRYGEEIALAVNCPAVKGIETLPNTGPGTSLLVGFTTLTIVGYFFARSRLMAKELKLVKSEYAPTGGLL